jgi:hypothetical protein
MALTRLLKIIALLYEMQPEEQDALSAQLLEQRKAVWRQALADMAREFGCNSASPRPPSGRDLTELKALSDEDAKSIANTWNGDVERQVQRLYDANPRGNRYYYRKNMEAWAAQRSTWKNPQIALNTETVTREYAKSRFREMNVDSPRFVFDGPPPTCDVCVQEFAAGIVDENYVRKHPCPRHINCPHTWRVVNPQRIPCAEMWLG